MLLKSIPLWGGLCLLFNAGTAIAQTPANTFAASTNHSAIIRPDGSLWTSGINLEGQLGNGTTTCSTTPVRVKTEDPNTHWAQVAAGTSHTLALTTDGRLYTWGGNSKGQLGDGTTKQHLTPVAVKLPEEAAHATWKQVAAGTSHSLALTTDGHLYAWGNNTNGQLGQGTSLDYAHPVEVPLPESARNTTWAQVAAGNDHTLALTADGRLFAWGNNQFGQLGDGSYATSREPEAVGQTQKLAALRWANVAAGRFHTLAVTRDGKLYSWGSNRFGQLGEEDDTRRNLPTLMLMPGSLANAVWTQVAAGDAHSLALSADGRLVAWGNNCAGQLGDGTTVRQLQPVVVTLPENASAAVAWTRIASGGFHNLAYTADGQLYAWGANRFGQLGDGTALDHNQPMSQESVFTKQSSPSSSGSGGDLSSLDGVEAWGLNDTRLLKEMPKAPSFMMILQQARP
ncbi:hypothetical protein Q3A66_12515 [Hymenobacter sp. BT770]|uniref:RCC1 domain-containing protein n=1 Tax=Hymenobacter sp. BT770 TaxID=2886942 RepID=UPI001D12CF78|nr:hypothetical protein [Hymenobacter sp. BT770]MCC3153644.1 hypothetical protein [Hymenobacter sp. BT770]MDO3415890.1 hypothetical protein [Hymenobacter sp. BT770]